MSTFNSSALRGEEAGALEKSPLVAGLLRVWMIWT
jgi:hypothetical protein